MYVYIYIYVYVYIYIYTYIHTCISLYRMVWPWGDMFNYIYIYTYILNKKRYIYIYRASQTVENAAFGGNVHFFKVFQ